MTNVDISKSVISQNNMTHLWVALHYNISVIELNYSRINFLAIESIRAVDEEVYLNRMIKTEILPQVELLKRSNPYTGNKELCLKGI